MEQALPDPRPEIPEVLRLAGLEALQADSAIQARTGPGAGEHAGAGGTGASSG